MGSISADVTAARALTHSLMKFEKTMNTDKHLTASTSAMFSILADAFVRETDLMAEVNEEDFMHVYEWDEVGLRPGRLFQPTLAGRGGTRYISWKWLPSKTHVPINPEDYPSDFDTDRLNDTHVFTWKAPVMEYGATVHVHRRWSKVLVIPYPKSYRGLGTGKLHTDGSKSVLVTPHPYSFSPGQKAGVVGNFSGWFQQWFASRADSIIDEVFVIERDNEFKRLFEEEMSGVARTRSRTKTMKFMAGTEGALLGARVADRVTEKLEKKYIAMAKRRRSWEVE